MTDRSRDDRPGGGPSVWPDDGAQGASSDPDPVADAWEASSLNRWTVPAFHRRLELHRAEPDPIDRLAGPQGQHPLPAVDDRLQRLLSARRSTRRFAAGRLDAASVARVLAAVGPALPGRRPPARLPGWLPGWLSGRSAEDRAGDRGGRVVPSPGGLQTVTVFAVGLDVEGLLDGMIGRYDHRRHQVAVIGPAPPAPEVRRLCSLDCEGDPQLVLWWIVDPGPALDRYGARALRLVLQEVGHAAQNVALRLAADGLAGYHLGGVLDDDVLALLDLTGLDLWVAGGMTCGLPDRSGG
jgi:hypothetical protein